VQVPPGAPFSRNVAQYSERPAWDREVAGENPAIPTSLRLLSYGSASHFKMLPWPNTRGIRLLNGTMQVEVLPAVPLPGGVKVARRFVKPHGVGASPTLAANLGRQADISWLRLSRKQDPSKRRSEHYRRLPPSSSSSKAEHPADNRKTTERYRGGRPAFAKAAAGKPAWPRPISPGS
jgi:hypothetical protein